MISADLHKDGDQIVLESDYPLRDRDRIKELPGVRFRLGGWTAPLSWATAIQLRGIFGNELDVKPDLVQWSIDTWETRVEPAVNIRQSLELQEPEPIMEAWRTDGKVKNEKGEVQTLYTFQEAGVKFLSIARKTYLCDEMGAGKTCQSASAMRFLAEKGEQPFPALVVVKSSLIRSWERELKMWLPDAKVVTVFGSAAKRREALATPADVYIITFASVKAHSRLSGYGSIRLRRCHVCDTSLTDAKEFSQTKCQRCPKELNERSWKTIIVDEAHALADPKSQQTRAIWALNTPETENVYLLTGTPVVNAPHNMWPGLHMLDSDSFSNHSKFIDRYCVVRRNPFGGVNFEGLNLEHREEFYKIIDPMLRRMPKEAVLPFLPKKQYVMRMLEMTTKQKTAYDQMKKGMIADLGDGAVTADTMLTRATRLDQLANAYLEEQEDHTVRMVAPSNKVSEVFEVLDELGPDEPLVIAAGGPGSRGLIELTAEALDKAKISYSKVVGGLTPDQVDKSVQDFQAGKVRVILVTTAKGGVGLTLTRSRYLLFMKRPWSPVESKQMEDRCHRIGSEIHDKITIIDLISTGTVEEKRVKVLNDKGERLEEVVRDKNFLLWLLDLEEEK